MESFTIKGDSDNFVTVTLTEVIGFPELNRNSDRYEVEASVEIKSRGFIVKSTMRTSTCDIFEFFQQLKSCNNKLSGSAYYRPYEDNLELIAEYNNDGHVNIKGEFSELNQFANKLEFEFTTDQTFIHTTIEELELIANKYGDRKVLKK